MRYLSIALVALAALVLQTGVGRILGLAQLRIVPDLLLCVAIVLAFQGQPGQFLPACWAMGLIKDLSSQAVLGSYAVGFGIMALLILYLRGLLYGQRVLPRMFLAALFTFALEQWAYAVYTWHGQSVGDYATLSRTMLFSALLTAGLYPYVQWLLLKFHGPLSLTTQRKYNSLRD